jgi:hypothetical protein
LLKTWQLNKKVKLFLIFYLNIFSPNLFPPEKAGLESINLFALIYT